MPEATLVIQVEDKYSDAVKKMSAVTKSFSKDADEMNDALEALSRQKGPLKAALKEMGRELSAAQAQFNHTGDEASRLRLELAQAKYDTARRNLDLLTRTARAAEQQLRDTGSAGRGLGEGVQSGIKSAVNAFITSGLGDVAGNFFSTLGTSMAGSAFGAAGGNTVGTALQAAVSGAAFGTMVGPPVVGTVAGALAGGAIGLMTGEIQAEEGRDEAFQSYVQQAVEGQLEEMESIRASGSATAGQREREQLLFARQLGGEGAARDYLEQAGALAAGTGYTYDEVVRYSKSLLDSYSPEEALGALEQLSGAAAGLNLDSSGMSALVDGLARLRTAGEMTQEELDYFSARGLDVYDALARSTGADKSQIAGMVTDGDISGTQAAQAILDYIQEEFGGLGEKLADTYDVMADNLAEAEDSLNARMGEGYNEARKSGLEAQQAWLESDQLGEAYEAIGAWKAELENAKEQYIRDAVDEAMGSEEYQAADAAGDAAEMGRIIMQAKIRGMGEYNANEGRDEVLAQELALIEGVREDAAANEGYWDAGYTLGQAFSKGRLAGMRENLPGSAGLERDGFVLNPDGTVSQTSQDPGYRIVGNLQRGGYYLWDDGSRSYTLTGPRFAYGIQRVPYDNYAALLHEGERVLTASQARELDRGGSGGGVTVNLSGSWTVRSEEDAEELAEILVRKIELAQKAGVIG